MASELTPIDISHLPELAQLAEDVQRTRTPRLLRRGDEDVAVLTPTPPTRPRRRTARPVTEDDALFQLIGIGRSGIPGGISGKKHEALRGALRHL